MHRYTHRIVRGCLLAIGRPDGRLNALTSAEAAIHTTVYQSTSIQNYRATCETITIGHSPYKLPLSKRCLTLPGNRPKFFCEAECDARLGSEALNGVSPVALMNKMATILGSTSSLALSKMKTRRPGPVKKQKSQENIGKCAGGSNAMGRLWERAAADNAGGSFAPKLKNIEKVVQPFIGAWMEIHKPQHSATRGIVGHTVGDLMEKQRFLQVMLKRKGIPSIQPTAQSFPTRL